jgi:hypothetical protein
MGSTSERLAAMDDGPRAAADHGSLEALLSQRRACALAGPAR